MEAAKKRILARQRKKAHIRKTMSGTAEYPRVTIFRSAKHIYAQAIDDVAGRTIASISSRDKGMKDQFEGFTGNKAAASVAGKVFGKKLKEKGVTQVVFDRNGFIYHGRVKSLADGIRGSGIKF